MSAAKKISVTLTEEMAELVRAKVESGAYASESDVINEGLLELQARDQTLEEWLRNEILPAYDEFKADPSRAISADELKAGLKARHERAMQKRAMARD